MVQPESPPHPEAAADGECLKRCFPGLIFHGLLGVGGMGCVYLVEHPVLRRRMALKVLHPDRSATEGFTERFAREARLLATLQHPNILTLIEFGTAADPENSATLHWHTTEYIEGQTLRSLLETGPLAPERVTAIMQQLFTGLRHAHAQGIIHRDLKPDNLLMDLHGVVKIADFGLARPATPTNDSLYLTQTRQLIGTPQYMAPEQLTGKSTPDARSDVYSLAVLCYELLTGELPLGRFAVPSEKAPVSPQLDSVLLTAMAGNPADRFQSIEEFAAAWSAAIEDHDFFYRPPGAGLSTVIDRTLNLAWQRLAGNRQPAAARKTDGPAVLQAIVAGIGAAGLVQLARLHRTFLISNLHQQVFTVLMIVLFTLATGISLSCFRWRRLNLVNRSVMVVVAIILLVLSFVGLLTSGSAVWTLCLGLPAVSSAVLLVLSIQSFVPALRKELEDRKHDAATLSIRCPEEYCSQRELPQLCATCGLPGEHSVERRIDYYRKADEKLMMLGFFCGVIPGVILAATRHRTLTVRIPLCRQHMHDRRFLVLVASIGWLLIPVFGLTAGSLAAMLCIGLLHWSAVLPIILAAVVGVLTGAGYYVGLILPPWQPVTRVSRLEEGKPAVGIVLLDHLHPGFADAIRTDLAVSAAGLVQTPGSARQLRS